ncbi:hypothetical protein [Streptomyces sp. NPDC005828]|uniref:hypothetical protein n=1 Tax=Streptomyces sp. NPDC005828 TaxID=3157071 RepID=UPI0033FA37D6
MAAYLLACSEDHLFSVELTRFTPMGPLRDGVAEWRDTLDAGRPAVTFPPQRIEEETSSAVSMPLSILPAGEGAAPVWRDTLPGLGRVVVVPERDSTVVPTVEPASGLMLQPEGAGRGAAVRSCHPTLPVTASETSGLWRSRLVAGHQARTTGATTVLCA